MPGTSDDPFATVLPGPEPLDELGIPELLAGRYRILERIGEGGMGIVCRGFDLDLEETIAVKFLRAEFADDDHLRARFRREVKMARRVTHPNVARVFEFGRDGELCFLTMEYVAGDSLQALLRRAGRLPPGEVRALAVSLCEALAVAHDADVVHGDLKPGNILVAPGRGAVLTDFGIAQALTGPRGAEEGPSGTPFYMAPEQVRCEPIGPETDVYALGVVLFEALTGVSPWPDDDVLGQLAYKRHGHEPALARLAPDLPPVWLHLITDCLRNERRQRPGDTRAILARLAPGELVVPSTPQRAEPLVTSAGPRWLEIVPTASAAPGLAWVAADLRDALTHTRGLRVRSAGAEALVGCAVVRVEAEARELADGVEVEVRVRDGDGPHTGFTVQEPRAALHHLGAEVAARIAAFVDESPAPRRRDVLDASASELYVQARRAYLHVQHERAIELYQAALALAPDSAQIKVGLTIARIQWAFMFREASPDEIAELRGAAEEAVREHGEHGESHLARARVHIALGESAAGARSLCDAIARSPSLVEAHVMLADNLLDIGRLPDASRRLDIALALDRSSVYAWICRARQFAYQERWDELRELATESFPEVALRGVLPRLLLWHPDRDLLESLERLLAANHELPRPVWQGAQLLVAFALAREDRGALIDRLAERFEPSTNMRRNAFLAQVLCELACAHGQLSRALEFLAAADGYLVTDWQWIERCPLLAPIRGRPEFAAVRERVRVRADAIADAIWG